MDVRAPDLKTRVAATKWPDRGQVADDTQGVQVATMQKRAVLGNGIRARRAPCPRPREADAYWK